MRDRVYGIQETLFHDPYYQRHVVGAPVLRGVGDDGIRCESNYAGVSHQAQRPVDRVQRRPLHRPRGVHTRWPEICRAVGDLRFRMIPNSIIYPI